MDEWKWTHTDMCTIRNPNTFFMSGRLILKAHAEMFCVNTPAFPDGRVPGSLIRVSSLARTAHTHTYIHTHTHAHLQSHWCVGRHGRAGETWASAVVTGSTLVRSILLGLQGARRRVVRKEKGEREILHSLSLSFTHTHTLTQTCSGRSSQERTTVYSKLTS